MLSGEAFSEVIEEIMHLGANGYLKKPVNLNEFRSVVQRVILESHPIVN